MIELLFSYSSPYGDYGSYRLDFSTYVPDGFGSFRPLAGIMALIGIMIYLNNDGTDCFRPLTGIMVLIVLHTFALNVGQP